MANNYTQSSFALSPSSQGRDWLRAACDEMQRMAEDDMLDEDNLCSELFHGNPIDYWDWRYDISREGELLLYAEEGGNMDAMAILLQEFLRRFDPDKCIEIEWAETCSSLRPGEFGGGACFITAEEHRFMSTGSWLHDQGAAFSEGRCLNN